MWPFSLRKKSNFHEMLLAQAAEVETGLAALVAFMASPTDENAKKVEAIEEEADELRRIIIDELNRTFVTPIDREDIFALSRAIDDVMDYADSTVEEMTLFGIEPDAFMWSMIEKLCGATKDIVSAIKHLREHPAISAEHNIRAKKAENAIERDYRKALAELFKTNDVIRILKTREIYRHLSNAADRVGEAADIIGDIMMKNA